MREHGDGGDDAEVRVGQEGGGDQHAIQQVVERVAPEDQRRGRAVAVVILRTMRLAGVHVAMAPEHHLLEHEEGDDAAGERKADAVRAGAGIERMRQERKQRGPEQRAGREAHEVRQQRVPPRGRQQHEAAGDECRQGAAGAGQEQYVSQ